LKREIISTKDGSKTIHIPEWNEQYHSTHGAIQEAKHVYLNEGLAFFFLTSEGFNNTTKTVSILEIGFGTGLNAFLTLAEAEKQQININYVGIEGFPVNPLELKQLNYTEAITFKNSKKYFHDLHDCNWESRCKISNYFSLEKQQKQFKAIADLERFNIIYFDAFGPRVQPELWTETIFTKMYKALKPKGVLVTYCAQGNARRAMSSVGFTVTKIDGPPGKRHMLRAVKS